MPIHQTIVTTIKSDYMNNLNCEQIREHLRNGARLLDVRTTSEHSSSALPNSVNIPLHILPILADEHLNTEDAIYIYCRSGGRAFMAEKILKNMGYNNIYNIGGIEQYIQCAETNTTQWIN